MGDCDIASCRRVHVAGGALRRPPCLTPCLGLPGLLAPKGSDDDPSVSKERLASRLTQTLCKVDVIETNGDADLRAQRKKQYQRCLAALDSLEHH